MDEAILYFNQSSLIQLDISYTKKSTKTLPHPTVFPVLPFFAKSDFSTAMHMLKKALAIDEKVHGEDHPDTAMRYNNLGIVAQEIEDSNDSARMHEKALSIRGKLLKTNHLDTAQSYNNLGLEMHSKGDHTKCSKKPLWCISKLSVTATLSLLQHAIALARFFKTWTRIEQCGTQILQKSTCNSPSNT